MTALCHRCGRDARSVRGHLERANPIGETPAVWACYPGCATDPADFTDADLRLRAQHHDAPLPVYHPTAVRGDPVGNFYVMDTREGATITTMCERGVYWVLVAHGLGMRSYTDAENPHARNVFWCALAMAHTQLESGR